MIFAHKNIQSLEIDGKIGLLSLSNLHDFLGPKSLSPLKTHISICRQLKTISTAGVIYSEQPPKDSNQNKDSEARMIPNYSIMSLDKLGSTNHSSYFRFLNPTSKNSGIFYPYKEGSAHEVIDKTVSEKISEALISNSYNMWDIIVGNHFDCNVFSNSKKQYDNSSSKGILDFLIFPLIARKLMVYVLIENINLDLKTVLAKTIALCIAIPLEAIRFSVGIALSLLLVPIVALVKIVKPCLSEDLIETDSCSLKPAA